MLHVNLFIGCMLLYCIGLPLHVPAYGADIKLANKDDSGGTDILDGAKAIAAVKSSVSDEVYQEIKDRFSKRVGSARLVSLRLDKLNIKVFGVLKEAVPGSEFPERFVIGEATVIVDGDIVVDPLRFRPLGSAIIAGRDAPTANAAIWITNLEKRVVICKPVESGAGRTWLLRTYGKTGVFDISVEYPNAEPGRHAVFPHIPEVRKDTGEAGKLLYRCFVDFMGEYDGMDGFNIPVSSERTVDLTSVPKWLRPEVIKVDVKNDDPTKN